MFVQESKELHFTLPKKRRELMDDETREGERSFLYFAPSSLVYYFVCVSLSSFSFLQTAPRIQWIKSINPSKSTGAQVKREGKLQQTRKVKGTQTHTLTHKSIESHSFDPFQQTLDTTQHITLHDRAN